MSDQDTNKKIVVSKLASGMVNKMNKEANSIFIAASPQLVRDFLEALESTEKKLGVAREGLEQIKHGPVNVRTETRWNGDEEAQVVMVHCGDCLEKKSLAQKALEEIGEAGKDLWA